jgi:hypothetical protein
VKEEKWGVRKGFRLPWSGLVHAPLQFNNYSEWWIFDSIMLYLHPQQVIFGRIGIEPAAQVSEIYHAGRTDPIMLYPLKGWPEIRSSSASGAKLQGKVLPGEYLHVCRLAVAVYHVDPGVKLPHDLRYLVCELLEILIRYAPGGVHRDRQSPTSSDLREGRYRFMWTYLLLGGKPTTVV